MYFYSDHHSETEEREKETILLRFPWCNDADIRAMRREVRVGLPGDPFHTLYRTTVL